MNRYLGWQGHAGFWCFLAYVCFLLLTFFWLTFEKQMAEACKKLAEYMRCWRQHLCRWIVQRKIGYFRSLTRTSDPPAGACAAAETHGPALSGHGLRRGGSVVKNWGRQYLKLWHVIVILCFFNVIFQIGTDDKHWSTNGLGDDYQMFKLMHVVAVNFWPPTSVKKNVTTDWMIWMHSQKFSWQKSIEIQYHPVNCVTHTHIHSHTLHPESDTFMRPRAGVAVFRTATTPGLLPWHVREDLLDSKTGANYCQLMMSW